MRFKRTSMVDDKYGVLGLEEERIPSSAQDGLALEEPVFVLRAQDDLALHTITRYRNTAAGIEDEDVRPSQAWFDGVDAVIAKFAAFRAENPDSIKVPD